jgi:hypothetical protein
VNNKPSGKQTQASEEESSDDSSSSRVDESSFYLELLIISCRLSYVDETYLLVEFTGKLQKACSRREKNYLKSSLF